MAADNITRENMAVVLVRAFDNVYGLDLVSYVESQDFDKDVIDLTKAKAEARPAIDVLGLFRYHEPGCTCVQSEKYNNTRPVRYILIQND